MDVLHSALWVSDLESTLEFYETEIGLTKLNEFEGGDGATNVYLEGDNGVVLQFKHHPDRDNDEPIEPTALDHLAFGVDDVDATVEHLVEEAGCTHVRGPLDSEGASARIAFIEDPNGYGIELIDDDAFDD
ncbi:lactoylglutathione lyase [Halarchaeum solikamskense]|uniref:VOC family protein n=1 Tax=Halarchaeum nitratireducens TaxID=489913 RepID=UPI001B3ACFCA|nr:VOC family protein [Halarchaeum solikamskense]MBP2249841.1 lactoylglutathione lyase [Halarchaeum solikamskense]